MVDTYSSFSRFAVTPLTSTLYAMLKHARPDRMVAPEEQPFAFVTMCGKVRKRNEDTALVVVGLRPGRIEPFLAAVVCDGMGGHADGEEAARITASMIGSVLAASGSVEPSERMRQAIRYANSEVFGRLGGHSGAVVVAALFEEGQRVIGWVGDARAYGLKKDKEPELLTQDDTIAAEVARLEGPSPEALDAVMRAVGPKAEVSPHIASVPDGIQTLLLLSDGVHRIEPQALAWVHRHSQSPSELVHNLRWAALIEGGRDNATALAVEIDRLPKLDEKSEILGIWVEVQPRIHVHQEPEPLARPTPQEQRQEARQEEPSKARPKKQRGSRPKRNGGSSSLNEKQGKTNVEQESLRIEIDEGPEENL